MSAIPVRSAPRLLRAAVLLLLLPVAADGMATPVAFLSHGGEAWTFEKRIEAAAEPQCDAIAFTSPRGTVVARTQTGRASATVLLEPGRNSVTAECRRDGQRHGAAAVQDWRVRLADAPRARINATPSIGGMILDAALSTRAPVHATPISRYAWRPARGNLAPLAGLPAHGQALMLRRPQREGEYGVTLRVIDAQGRSDETTILVRVAAGRMEAIDTMREVPSWAEHAVVYGVIPSLFGPRGFDDVTARLDDLAALGVTTLWLSPITAAPDDDFGYAVSDHFRLRQNFGSESDFRRLVTEAHKRGLRVIMDFVPNHVSDRHAYFRDVEAQGEASPYFSFFERDDEGEVASYFDWEHLKNLNYDHPEVRRLIVEAFASWVRKFDVDGFRVDVAWGPRERAPDFWPQLHRELTRIKPDLLLLAEASARDRYYVEEGFDAAYDWTEKLGEWAWRDAFEDEMRPAARLREAISPSLTGDDDALVFRFLNNNDTGERFVTRYGPERTRVAAAMLLSLPGIPGLYTGDEFGAGYEPYDEGPPLPRDDPHRLQEWYARLIALRHATPALRAPALRFVETGADEQVLAYLRTTGDPREDVLVLLNYGASPARIALTPELRALAHDLLTGAPVPAGNPLPAYGVRILARR